MESARLVRSRALLAPCLALMAACQGLRWEPLDDETAVRYACRNGARTVAVCRVEASPFKPFVERLHTPAGVQLLRDAPDDHLHHHALMFGIRVDRTNFWEEQDRPGTQRVRSLDVAGDRLLASLAWTTDAGDVLLDERRELRCTSLPDACRLTWRTALETAHGLDSVVLSGAHYHGLGMRFVAALDGAATFLHPPRVTSEIVRGTERWSSGGWAACQGVIEGREVTVAMMSHPDHALPTLWFTMTAPFAYLSATADGWRQPVTLAKGEVLEFVHAVVLFDGRVGAEQIQTHYDRWRAVTAAPRTR